MHDLSRRLMSEYLGTALLLISVVGSGLTAERLATEKGIAMLGSAAATGATLFMIISIFAPVSGAHFNPLVTLGAAVRGILAWHYAWLYILVQITGAISGVILMHWMFDLPLMRSTHTVMGTRSLWVSEAFTSCGLMVSIMMANHYARQQMAAIVAAYVATTFYCLPLSIANPAAALARSITDTMFGVAKADLATVMLMQITGGLLGGAIASFLLRREVRQTDTKTLSSRG